MNRMNLLVWLPSLMSSVCLGLALFLTARLELQQGLSLQYLYIGTAVPILLLLLRQALDFTYREELVQQNAQSGRRGDHERDHQGIYGLKISFDAVNGVNGNNLKVNCGLLGDASCRIREFLLY